MSPSLKQSSVETARFDNKAHMAVVVCDARCRNSIPVGSVYPYVEYISDRRIVSTDVTYDDGGEYVKFIRRQDDCYGLVVKQ